MVRDLDHMTFSGLLNAKHAIRIPKIQRDYAEGRLTEKVSQIRRTFLNSLLQAIFDPKEATLEMDFIYGYERNNAFEPLDGQQRLTTLFLLHWLFLPKDSTALQIKEADKPIRSAFTYQTRISAEEFCDEIVKHNAREFVVQPALGVKLSSYLKNCDWFKWAWRKDPTVKSMLVVLDDIVELIGEHGYDFEHASLAGLERIQFNLLDLDQFTMGDELYVKMNARGKQLSDFDKLKSTLEEELQIQIEHASNDEEKARLKGMEDSWRTSMDREWIDYFWHKRTVLDDGRVDVVRVEDQFMRLLLRLIARQFCLDPMESRLAMLSNATDEKTLEQIVPSYVALSWKARKVGDNNFHFLDFFRLRDDLNAVICSRVDAEGTKEWINFSEVLDQDCLWSTDDAATLWDLYMADSFTYPDRVGFYAMLDFLRKCSLGVMTRGEGAHGQQNRLTDFCEWYRFVRNCIVNENTNERIDKLYRALNTIRLMSEFIDSFFSKPQDMLAFINGLGHHVGIENARIDEEKLKAGLRMANGEWTASIKEAESDPYLFGQVVAPLLWSKEGEGYNRQKFVAYASSLGKLFGDITRRNDGGYRGKIYAALFALGDYRFGGRQANAGTFNFERDLSFKRYLRDAGNNTMAPAIKELIDSWHTNYQNINSAADLADVIVNSSREGVTGWRKLLLDMPKLLLSYTNYAVVWSCAEDGHTYLACGKTTKSRSYEVLCSYLYEQADPKGRKIFDSLALAVDRCCVEFVRDGETYRVQPTSGGLYKVNVGVNVSENQTSEQVFAALGMEMS